MKKKEVEVISPEEELKKISEEFKLWIPGEKYNKKGKYFFSSQSTLLDLAIGGEGLGIPSGKIIEISGLESSGKTVIAALLAASCQKQGGMVVFFDVESTLDLHWHKHHGLDPEKIFMPKDPPETIEKLFNKIFEILEKTKQKNYCFLIDSIAAIETEEEASKEIGEEGYGTQVPKRLSRIFKKLPGLLSEKEATLVFVNQLRENIKKGTFGQKYYTPCGQALKFYCSVRFRITRKVKLKNIRGDVIGMDTEVELIKNKIDRPFLKAQFPIYFNALGLDDLESCVDFLRSNSFLGKGPWYVYSETKDGTPKEYKAQGKIPFLNLLEENNLIGTIQKETRKVWKELYSMDSRREKSLEELPF